MEFEKLAIVYKEEYDFIAALFTSEDVVFFDADLLMNLDDAWRAIACYLWIDYDETNIMEKKSKYKSLITKLAITYYNNSQVEHKNIKGDYAVTQMSQGSRSITYRSVLTEIDSNGLTAEVKAALPPRSLRVL